MGNHFVANKGRPGVLATANLEARTIPLITPPGIAILANPCQSNVSTPAKAARTSFDLLLFIVIVSVSSSSSDRTV